MHKIGHVLGILDLEENAFNYQIPLSFETVDIQLFMMNIENNVYFSSSFFRSFIVEFFKFASFPIYKLETSENFELEIHLVSRTYWC